MGNEVYNLDSFKALIQFGYSLGWYSGRKNLFTLRMEGEFEGQGEGFGSCHEDWGQRFVIETEEIKVDGGKVIPAVKVYGHTVDDVCKRALDKLTGNAPLEDEDVPY